jgi:hypothetical protein
MTSGVFADPALTKFLLKRHGVVGELSSMLPVIVSWKICAARIDNRIGIIADMVCLKVGFFEAGKIWTDRAGDDVS